MEKIFRCYKCYSQEWDEWGLDIEKILEDNTINRRAFASEYCADINVPELNDFINMKINDFNTSEIDYDWDEPDGYYFEVIDIDDEIKKLEEKIAQLKLYNK